MFRRSAVAALAATIAAAVALGVGIASDHVDWVGQDLGMLLVIAYFLLFVAATILNAGVLIASAVRAFRTRARPFRWFFVYLLVVIAFYGTIVVLLVQSG